MNQPSASAPVAERTPVMCEAMIGSLNLMAHSTADSGRYLAAE